MMPKSDRPILAIITSNWLSLFGACLVTTAAICWMLALPSQVRGHVTNPYIGILLFVGLPIIFLSGLCLIPIGVYLSRRRIAIDRNTSIRRLALFLGVTTFFNIIIGSQLTYRAVEHMESVQFCGATCHVMKPQFSAYQNRMHSRVLCVECHVAPGASGWLESKLSGTRQLMAVALGNYPRPIQSAMESNRLVASSETCEHCHQPEKAGAVKLRVIPNYKDDEQNTPSYTVLSLTSGTADALSGIHGAHFGPNVRIRYAVADSKRQTIPWVERKDISAGTVKTYLAADTKPELIAELPKYDMQCVDCHNRPAHTFELAERAINRAIASGAIPPSLPFIKKQGLQLLNQQYRSNEEATQKIVSGVKQYYQSEHPSLPPERTAEIERAAKALSMIYAQNVFPDLRVTWGTYPNNLGHTDFPGCFRCHDESHTAADGKAITQDCSTCHQMLAVDEAAPEILKSLNLMDRIGEVQKY